MTKNPATSTLPVFPRRSYQHVRAELLAGREIALLDVREEDPHAQAHPLFAANLPLARIELDAYAKLPRRDTTSVLLRCRRTNPASTSSSRGWFGARPTASNSVSGVHENGRPVQSNLTSHPATDAGRGFVISAG